MRQENLTALELGRPHIGLLVKVVTDSFSIIGTLERVQHDDSKEWDLDGRPRRRELSSLLRISGWTGAINPQQVVTVEWPEPLQGAQLEELAGLALEELEALEPEPEPALEPEPEPEPELPPAGEWQAAGSLASGGRAYIAPVDAPAPVLKPEPEAIPGEVVDGSVWVTGRVVPCGPQLNGNWHCNVARCSRPADERCPLRMLEELGEGQE